MKINVTQDHINRGCAEDCHSCPIAIAIEELTNDRSYSVSRMRVFKQGHFEDSPWLLPESARDFILRFDEGWPVQPFSFEIDLPEGKNHGPK